MTPDWKPGYSTTKTRYPYDGIESKTVFSNRPEFVQDKETNRIGVHIDASIYPQVTNAFTESEDAIENKQLMIDFLMDRAFDFQEALKIAENQVAELLSEDPFIPEQFGFDLIHKPETIHDSPIRIYQSKYDDRYTLHRPVQDVFNDQEWDPTIWILQTNNHDNTITSEEVRIPCHRIAFAFFYAKNIQVMENKKEDFIKEAEVVEEPVIEQSESVGPVVEEKPKSQEKTNLWSVEWNHENREPIKVDNIPAETAQDAMTKAKFVIETGDYGVEVVEFEDLHIVN